MIQFGSVWVNTTVFWWVIALIVITTVVYFVTRYAWIKARESHTAHLVSVEPEKEDVLHRELEHDVRRIRYWYRIAAIVSVAVWILIIVGLGLFSGGGVTQDPVSLVPEDSGLGEVDTKTPEEINQQYEDGVKQGLEESHEKKEDASKQSYEESLSDAEEHREEQ